jgi:hypothetical protein
MTYTEQRRAGKLKERAEKKKGIKARSKKMIDQLKIYNRVRNEYLKTFPICGVMACDNWSSEVHHKKGRGVYLMDQTTWMPVCRYCHRKIENLPIWAKAMGYSENRLT